MKTRRDEKAKRNKKKKRRHRGITIVFTENTICFLSGMVFGYGLKKFLDSLEAEFMESDKPDLKLIKGEKDGEQ